MWTCICRSILIKIILILVNGLPCFLHSRTIRFKIIILAIDLFQSGCRISGILHIIKLSIICYELISVEHTILIEITGMSIDSCKSGCCLSVTAKIKLLAIDRAPFILDHSSIFCKIIIRSLYLFQTGECISLISNKINISIYCKELAFLKYAILIKEITMSVNRTETCLCLSIIAKVELFAVDRFPGLNCHSALFAEVIISSLYLLQAGKRMSLISNKKSLSIYLEKFALLQLTLIIKVIPVAINRTETRFCLSVIAKEEFLTIDYFPDLLLHSAILIKEISGITDLLFTGNCLTIFLTEIIGFSGKNLPALYCLSILVILPAAFYIYPAVFHCCQFCTGCCL